MGRDANIGNAPCSFSGDVTELKLKGFLLQTLTVFMVDLMLDNSGSVQYLSIRHGGAEIGEGNEINGLTLGGVGSGTKINHVEVVANVDDGIEFLWNSKCYKSFGMGTGDDAIDIDQAYAGTIDGAMVILTDASDHGFEVDGPEGRSWELYT